MSNLNLSNIAGKIKTAEIFKKLGKGVGNINEDRSDRLPSGQRLLSDRNQFPILDLGFQPEFDPKTYRFQVTGLVDNPIDFSFDELINKFPETNLTADFHCVTRWSQYDIEWSGIRYLDIEALVKPKNEAKFIIQYGLDDYTTNAPITDFKSDNILLAYKLRGEDLPLEHGAPLRMIIPSLYGWKGSKFLYKLEYVEKDKPGFWEVRGYSNHGDPWKEERYS